MPSPPNLLHSSLQDQTRTSCGRFVLVLYLERPGTQQCAVDALAAGRFGYSDLKEAALLEAYVLCIGLNGCRGIGWRLSWALSGVLEAGWSVRWLSEG